MNCQRKTAVKKSIFAGALALLLIAGIQGCGPSGKDYAAAVDGEKITLGDFEDRLKVRMALMENSSSLTEDEAGRIRAEFLDELIDEKLMIARAKALKLDISDRELEARLAEIKADYPEGLEQYFDRPADFKSWKEDLKMRMLLEKVVENEVNSGITVTDDEVLAFFQANRNYGNFPERVRVSQIVLSDRDSARAALKRLKQGEDFAAVAKELSSGPEGSRGGDMGWFSRGSLPERLEKPVFRLKPGQVSKVLESPYGYHIFKVEKKEKAGSTSFAEVKERIRTDLKREKEGEAYKEWLERLRKDSRIAINEAALRAPLKSN